MGIAGTLSSANARIGVSPAEVANIALGNIGRGWIAGSDLSFVWGVSNLAGLPFFDPRNMTFNQDPTKPLDATFAVPHSQGILSSTADVFGDGWVSVSQTPDVNIVKGTVRPGDLVMIYAYGNTEETTTVGSMDAAHAMVVTSVDNGKVMVAHNWQSTTITAGDFDDVAASMSAGGAFGAAFVSRVDQAWVNGNVPDTVTGRGHGVFDGIGETAPDIAAQIDETTSDEILPGEMAVLHYSLFNLGDAETKPIVSTISLFASDRNSLISTLQVTDPIIPAGSSIQQMVDFVIPADLDEDDYYFRIQTGQVNNFNDSNPANNYSEFFIVSVSEPASDDLPNLRLDNVMLDDTTILAGETTTIRYDVVNDGDSDAGTSRTGFYISTDATLDDGDIFLEYDSVTVPAGDEDAEYEVLGGLSDLAAGSYYIFAVADYSDMEAETNESDNQAASLILTIEPTAAGPVDRDLAAESASVDRVTVEAGDEVTLSWTIENLGDAAISGGSSGIYLSTDPNVTQGDTLLGAVPFGLLDMGDDEDESFTFDMPNLFAGTYYLAAITDHSDLVVEVNEGNNTTDPLALTFVDNSAPTTPQDDDTTVELGASGADHDVSTGTGNDRITTGSGADDIAAGAGDDIINAGPGDDVVDGGAGDDRINGEAGQDTARDAFGDNVIDGGDGDDTLITYSGSNSITGGDGRDILVGGVGNDTLTGGDDDDVLLGDIGSARYGNDDLSGGGGDDLLDGGGGADRFQFAPGDDTNTIATLTMTNGGAWAATGAGFDVNLDRVILDGFSTADGTAALAQMSDVNGHATFAAQGTTITFYDLSVADLTADIFVFA